MLAIGLTMLAPTAAGAQTATCTRDDAWAQMRPDWAADVLALTNGHRATLGLAPLAPSGTLTAAAGWKAAHMANFGYFSHDDPQNPTRTWDQRIRDCGYEYGAGENIAYGYRTPQEVFRGWLDSPGHRRNIESAAYRVLGVGAAVADGGRVYWVQNFGTRTDGSVTQPAPVATVVPDEDEGTDPTTPVPADAPSAPVAKDDSVTVDEDQDVRLDPLSNDFIDPEGEVELIQNEDPAHGTITQEGSELVYTPDADFTGTDTFHYWIADRFERTCGARITVTVEPANDAPVANVDRVTVRPRRTVFVRVLSNDVDVDGDPIVFDGLDQTPRLGGAVVNPADGVITYRARSGTSGRTDTITYLVSDGNGGLALGVLRVRIRR